MSNGWFKSSFSSGGDNCVEVRFHGDQIQVRDSKRGEGSPVLAFTEDEWQAFLDGVHADEFNISV